MRNRAVYPLVAFVAIGMVIFAFAPLVQYSVTVAVPFLPYRPVAYTACQSLAPPIVSLPPANESAQQALYNQCLARYPWSPIVVDGRASLAYHFFGIGEPPYPSVVPISEDTFYGILHMSGSSITAGEVSQYPNPVYNPSGVEVVNDSFEPDAVGRGNLTLTIRNLTNANITDILVLVSVPALVDTNTTVGGVNWMYSSAEFGLLTGFVPPFTSLVGEYLSIPPGGSSTASGDLIGSLPYGQTIHYSVEVRGNLSGSYFIASRTFSYRFPQRVPDTNWLHLFMGLVNQARNGSKLVESQALDSFAEQRFATAVQQPGISDYGFSSDAASFLGTTPKHVELAEDLLFPGQELPFEFQSVLQSSAPGHWAALMNSTYTKFGYYIGQGPYFSISSGCPVTEIPSAGINITQYFEGHGCTVTPISDAYWLVIVLSS